MKQVLTLFTLLILIAGCNPEEVEKPEEKGPLSMIINNNTYNFYPEDIEGRIIKETKRMDVIIQYYKTNVPGSSLVNVAALILTFVDGNFSEAGISYEKDGKNYLSADFNPVESFFVRNYKYDQTTRNLSFDYEGKLYESSYQPPFSTSTITLKGKVDLKNISENTNTQKTLPTSAFTTPNYSFSTVKATKRNDVESMIQHNHYFANNGYQLQISLNQLTLNTLQLPSTFTFDENSTGNKIAFMQFTGTPRATDIDLIQQQDWKTFPAKGDLTLNKKNPDGSYEGTFNLKIYNNNALIHETTNGTFIFTMN